MFSRRTRLGPSTGLFQMPVCTVFPCQVTSRGRPTLTERSCPLITTSRYISRLTQAGGRRALLAWPASPIDERHAMDLGLDGRTAVVTGASRGIGLAITRGLAAHGARVIAGARRSSAELDQLAKQGQVRVIEVDLADPGG